MATPVCFGGAIYQMKRFLIKANHTHPIGALACTFWIVFLIAGCATQKSRQDQSDFGKFYHNVTSKFNGYFNANELLEDGIVMLESQHVDNFNEILPIYKYRAATRPEAVAQDMDEAIKKVSVVATLHEGSDWVDDCYLLIGKAQYLKQDFESAQNALEFFMDEFNPNGTRINARPSKKDSKSRSKASASKRSSNSAKSEKQKRREAKIAERERKEYNKQVRKNKKKGTNRSATSKSDGSGNEIVATKRNTTPDPDPPLEVKEEMKPSEPGSMSHKPCYQEAQLWLAKTHIERENFPRVEYFLNSLKNNGSLQDHVARELPVAWAYYSIVRGNYKGAIPHLTSAIELAKKRQEKARYAYILGQIAEMEDLPVEARTYYAMAKDLKPSYELRFNAVLSMARTALLTGESNEAEVVASLEKMLKDEKNEEYRDQIYFTLGKLALQAGNVDEAIKQLKLAAENSGQNTAQATETQYLLATLYFEKGDYVNAKKAYDAALSTMAKIDERYKPTDRLSKNLTDIAKYLTQIALQDSLLRIAGMTEEQREALAKELLAAQKASSKQNMDGNLPNGNAGKNASSRALAAANGQFGNPPARPASNLGNTQASAFFAYDDRAIKRGKKAFDREWGRRPLADNWRLSSRIQNLNSISEIEDNTPVVEVVSEADLNRALKGVPGTEEEIEAANKIIQNAMLQLGTLYRDKLEDYQQSIDMLEDLLAEYPETEHRLDAYYQLYLSYLSLNDITKANKYKDLILKEFSASKYALALSDPDYVKKQLSEEQKIDRYYQEVFDLVEQYKYEEAKERIDKAKEQFGTNHELQPKFSILEAMCIGNLEGKDAYINALKTIIGNYPNTPEEIKARDMLLQLGEYQGSRLNLSKSNLSGPNFQVAPNALHFLLIMIHNQGSGDDQVNTQDAKIAVSNYNRKYHQLDRLKISSLVFDPKTRQSLILVRSFKNSERAMKYYDNSVKNSTEFLPENAEYDAFPVTQHNYREIIRQKSMEEYKLFFEENYTN